jgi:hypothetical protein
MLVKCLIVILCRWYLGSRSWKVILGGLCKSEVGCTSGRHFEADAIDDELLDARIPRF